MGLLDKIIEHETRAVETAAEERATNTVLRQQLMQQSGELKRVSLVGPGNTTIPALYNERERAYYPVFE